MTHLSAVITRDMYLTVSPSNWWLQVLEFDLKDSHLDASSFIDVVVKDYETIGKHKYVALNYHIENCDICLSHETILLHFYLVLFKSKYNMCCPHQWRMYSYLYLSKSTVKVLYYK